MADVLKLGDHLVTPRRGFTHHGIYIGNQQVIHYAGFINGLSNKGPVSVTSLERFDNGFGYWVENHLDRPYDAMDSVVRAYSRLGEDSYHILFNNCEHFVSWCIEGLHSSSQIRKYTQDVLDHSTALVRTLGVTMTKLWSRRLVA